ncbi:M23 family metallopeptidase [Heyndrickxia oleronia]|uniref:Peptidoglycan DD-metalloendopeptidase family protein n=1 Tax=Heyndrickxia oleronia TaxID=38875 RepID=A0AAW6STT7_9BACI|nr:M23 family metallopeptidase [Heyndrickxia oleronia]MDH5159979.1 peptidoglycan DD-metalloendopeptidase family protein [Heyndrickxia oleronia]
MLDYLKRMLIVAIMALCVSMLILGGRVQAAEINIYENTGDWYFPAEGEISDVFDSRSGIHKGLDIAGEYRSAVYAVEGGKVIRSYYSPSYGNVIFIHHDNGFETVYAHLQNRMVVEGQIVGKGDEIGKMGNTGNSTGVHLHFEIHKGQWTIDKVNAIDPFTVFGEGEIGQFVFALNHDPYRVIDVAGNLQEVQEKKQKEEQKEEQLTLNLTAKPIADRKVIITHFLAEIIGNQSIEKGQPIYVDNFLSSNKNKEEMYIVQSGDTLSKISRKFGVTIDQLLSWNNITNKDLIHTKQKIVIKHT